MQRFFGGFNRGFERNSTRYRQGVQTMLGRAGRMMVIYAVLLAGLVFASHDCPRRSCPTKTRAC